MIINNYEGTGCNSSETSTRITTWYCTAAHHKRLQNYINCLENLRNTISYDRQLTIPMYRLTKYEISFTLSSSASLLMTWEIELFFHVTSLHTVISLCLHRAGVCSVKMTQVHSYPWRHTTSLRLVHYWFGGGGDIHSLNIVLLSWFDYASAAYFNISFISVSI
jgi:hypothetical protein